VGQAHRGKPIGGEPIGGEPIGGEPIGGEGGLPLLQSAAAAASKSPPLSALAEIAYRGEPTGASLWASPASHMGKPNRPVKKVRRDFFTTHTLFNFIQRAENPARQYPANYLILLLERATPTLPPTYLYSCSSGLRQFLPPTYLYSCSSGLRQFLPPTYLYSCSSGLPTRKF
jgi:hypothetical protein